MTVRGVMQGSESSGRSRSGIAVADSDSSQAPVADVSMPRAKGAMMKSGNSNVSAVSKMSSAMPQMSGGRSIARKFQNKTTAWNKTINEFMMEEEPEDDNGSGSGIRNPTNRTSRTSSSNPPIGRLPLLRFHMRRLLVSRLFEIVISLVIVANSITIGVELSFELEGKDTFAVSVFEHIWLAIYVAELCLRIFAMGLECFRDNWVKFDAVLVIVGIINSWILPAFFFGASSDGFGFLMVIRMTRLARLARTVRLLVKFKALWMLVRGMLSSAGTMFYTFILLSVVLYIFAALGVELITNNALVSRDEEFREIVAANFDSLSSIMLTLVQFVCMDSIAAIYRPLIKKDSTLLFYFTGVILTVPIVLMNLVTAIIVNIALEQANADKQAQRDFEERRKAKLIKTLQGIFSRLDEDNSGEVSKEEIMNIEESDVQILMDATDMCDPLEVFNALNVDERQTLSIDDFCDGIWKMATSSATVEVQRMEKQVQVMFNRIKTIEQNQSLTNYRLEQILQRLASSDRKHHLPAPPPVENSRPLPSQSRPASTESALKSIMPSGWKNSIAAATAAATAAAALASTPPVASPMMFMSSDSGGCNGGGGGSGGGSFCGTGSIGSREGFRSEGVRSEGSLGRSGGIGGLAPYLSGIDEAECESERRSKSRASSAPEIEESSGPARLPGAPPPASRPVLLSDASMRPGSAGDVMALDIQT